MASRWMRFSLLSFLLFISLVCVSTSHVLVSRENLRLREANQQFRDELGILKIDDPNKIYLRPLRATDDLTWHYRVYLPPEKRFRLRIDREGSGGGSSSLGPFADQVSMTIAIRPQPKERWAIWVTTAAGSAHMSLFNADAKWDGLLQDRNLPFELLSRPQRELSPDQPHEILRIDSLDLKVSIEPDTLLQRHK